MDDLLEGVAGGVCALTVLPKKNQSAKTPRRARAYLPQQNPPVFTPLNIILASSSKMSALTLRGPQFLTNLQSLTVSWIKFDGIGDCFETFKEPGFHSTRCGQIHPTFRKTRRGAISQTEVPFRSREISSARCKITDLVFGECKTRIKFYYLLQCRQFICGVACAIESHSQFEIEESIVGGGVNRFTIQRNRLLTISGLECRFSLRRLAERPRIIRQRLQSFLGEPGLLLRLFIVAQRMQNHGEPVAHLRFAARSPKGKRLFQLFL